MIQIAIILITALVFSTFSTLFARWVALRMGVVSVPRTRDIHLAPVPLLGGAAIYVAFVVTLLIFNDRAYLRELFGILAGATLIALVGLADDRRGLRADLKMAGQLAAGVLLLLGGTQIQLFAQPGLNWGLTLFWVVGLANALNFLDNMDGLSGGVATIGSAYFLLLAAMNEPRQVLVGAMAAALMGACTGFLRYNLSPTKIFMGDAGSLFIGFILASLAIKLRFPSNIPLVTWMVPVCVLALPIFDTTLVFVARLRRRVNPFTTAGKDHLSHRLVALGMTRREAVLTCYLLTGACGMVGIYMTQARLYEAYIVAGALAGAALAGLIWLERYCPGGIRRPTANQAHAPNEA
jgi:UDP-GlcNAc:undecaprenyl-phosphate GlcNAc-1-phosphate transferase